MQVIRLRAAGKTYDEIAAQTGLTRTGVFDICKRHKLGGAAALKDKVGGRKLGEDRLLTADQERQILRLIQDKTPDQIKMPYALWSRQAVAELILDQFGIAVAVRTMGTYLKRWGFTPQKPLRRACEQSPVGRQSEQTTRFLEFVFIAGQPQLRRPAQQCSSHGFRALLGLHGLIKPA